MGLFEHWPYVNFHELNTNWLIAKVKNVETAEANSQASAEASAESAAASQLSAEAAQASQEAALQSELNAAQSEENAADSEANAKNYSDHIADPVSGIVTTWLRDNITPTTPAIDASLTVAGAAADALATGNAIKYADSVSIRLNKLSDREIFKLSANETIRVSSSDNTNMTPDYLRTYDIDGNRIDSYSLSGYSTKERIITTAAASYLISLEGGTAQEINIEKIDTDLSAAFTEQKNNVDRSLCINSVLSGLNEMKYMFVKGGHTMIIKSASGDIMTPEYLRLYNRNGAKLTDLSLADFGVSLRKYTPQNDVYKIELIGGTAQEIEVFDIDSKGSLYVNEKIGEYNETEKYKTYLYDLNKITEFIANNGDKIMFRSVDGSNMTPTYLYFYDKQLRRVNYYGLSGWGNKREIPIDGDVSYIMLIGGTAQNIEVTNNTLKKTALYEKIIPALYDYPLNVNDIDTTAKINAFESNVSNNAENESFIFFTDPHTLRSTPSSTDETYYMLSLIKKYYDDSSADFVLCGGDLLQDNDTPEAARNKLAYFVGHCDSMISPCYMMLGNHDTNYQGTETLAQGQIDNIMFRKQKKSYYSFMGHSAKFYILDSGTDGRTTLSAYENEQLAWLASSLLSENDLYIALGVHIFWANDQYAQTPLSAELKNIVNAFNSRGVYTFNGVTYNYSAKTGKVKFIITGHTHADMSETLSSGVPVIGTINAGSFNYAFDMINADFITNTIKCTRVGTGSDREFTMA